MARAITLGLMILLPTLVIMLTALVFFGVYLDVWVVYLVVGLGMYALLRAHRVGLHNPVGRIIEFALT